MVVSCFTLLYFYLVYIQIKGQYRSFPHLESILLLQLCLQKCKWPRSLNWLFCLIVGSDQNTTHVGVGWSQLLYVGGRKGVCWSLVTVGPKYGRRVLRANPDAPIRVCFTTHNLSKPSIKYINSLGVSVLSNVYLVPCPHIYTHCLSKVDINVGLVYKCNLSNRGAELGILLVPMYWPCVKYISQGAFSTDMQRFEMDQLLVWGFHRTNYSHCGLACLGNCWREEVEVFAFHVRRLSLSNYGCRGWHNFWSAN